jgi:outer membrane lipoprotein-sorting protein
MKTTLLLSALLSLLAAGAWAQETLSAAELLARIDAATAAPRDQDFEASLILSDKAGNRSERTLLIQQKGADRRMARFLSPADQKGISVLSLPDGSIYLYLPAYKKVKRIASHVKNSSFAGTDFTYEDMEAVRYADKYTATLGPADGQHYVLDLAPRDGQQTPWSRLRLWALKDSFLPVTLEYYDRKGTLARRMTSAAVEKIKGYWVAREREMHDLAADHRSRMVLTNIRFDSGLADELFTTRYLER